MKAPSPLLGFNNNFKHKGHVYHIQTEDSGVKHPHIITHLFADGGRILKSVKTSYATVVGDPTMADIVRNMMKEQHKAMIVALRDGQFDPVGAKEVKLPAGGPWTGTTSAGPQRPRNAEAGGAASAAVADPVPVVVPPPTTPSPSTPIDIGALERAAVAASQAHAGGGEFFPPHSDLPPPPPNVLGGDRQARPHGEYQNVASTAPRRPASIRPPGSEAPRSKSSPPSARPKSGPPAARAKSAPPPARRPGSSPSMPPGAGGSKPPAGRYALTRPASIFATNKPNPGSIFGEELISERSLDEVILSYLAEDLEGEKK